MFSVFVSIYLWYAFHVAFLQSRAPLNPLVQSSGILYTYVRRTHVTYPRGGWNNNEPPIWEWFIPPIYGDLGDGLLLFYHILPHYFLVNVYITPENQHFFMGKSTIHGPFSIAFCMFARVYPPFGFCHCFTNIVTLNKYQWPTLPQLFWFIAHLFAHMIPQFVDSLAPGFMLRRSPPVPSAPGVSCISDDDQHQWCHGATWQAIFRGFFEHDTLNKLGIMWVNRWGMKKNHGGHVGHWYLFMVIMWLKQY